MLKKFQTSPYFWEKTAAAINYEKTSTGNVLDLSIWDWSPKRSGWKLDKFKGEFSDSCKKLQKLLSVNKPGTTKTGKNLDISAKYGPKIRFIFPVHSNISNLLQLKIDETNGDFS